MSSMLTAAAAVLLVLSGFPGAEALGQRPNPRPAGAAGAAASQAVAHVVTVSVPTLDERGARAAIIRRPGVPGNLILVTGETTPADFLKAMRALNASRRSEGEEPTAELRAFIRAAKPEARPDARRRELLQQTAAHLAGVRRAPQRQIEGVGRFPALTAELRPLQR
jgi:hypothetical protein